MLQQPLKRMLLAAAAVLCLTACEPVSIGEDVTSTPATAQSTATSQAPPSVIVEEEITQAQMESIRAIRLGHVDYFAEFSDIDIARMFRQQCQALNNGRSMEDAIVDSQMETEMGFRLLGGAVASTCPEHIPALEEYSFDN